VKTGRNDPCPCGSGRKYKKCCLDKPDSSALDVGGSPASLVEKRRRALAQGDFGFIYDSYHPDSPFREHFPDRTAYLEYARSELRGKFEIRQCRVLREERLSVEEACVLFYLDVRHGGQRYESVELSRMLFQDGAWRYHSGWKTDRRTFACALEDIEPGEVKRLAEGICF
jgi:SEC-C motif-containing protein